MTSWRKLIDKALRFNNETWADIEATTLTEEQLNTEFDHDEYGYHSGCAFTLWTKARVYFPTTHDGYEGVSFVPRNPCDEATRHIGHE